MRPGDGIRAVKTVSLAEEYLADHFPGYPVLPGVLMLEALAQAGAWFLRVTEDFRDPLILLSRATHVRYGRFVRPGEALVVDVRLTGREEGLASFRGKGMAQGTDGGDPGVAVQARLQLRTGSLAQRDPDLAATDTHMVRELRRVLAELRAPSRAVAPAGGSA